MDDECSPESVEATRCHGELGCQGGTRCLTHSLWRDLSDRISHFLDEITLGELVRQAEVKQIAERQDKQKQVAHAVAHKLDVDAMSVSVQLG